MCIIMETTPLQHISENVVSGPRRTKGMIAGEFVWDTAIIQQGGRDWAESPDYTASDDSRLMRFHFNPQSVKKFEEDIANHGN